MKHLRSVRPSCALTFLAIFAALSGSSSALPPAFDFSKRTMLTNAAPELSNEKDLLAANGVIVSKD
ncbi:MAG: hypothetical protein ABI579_08485, partial [Candidatus Sumerlaeota bacterium]